MSELGQAIKRLERCLWDGRVIPIRADIQTLLDAYKALTRPPEPKHGGYVIYRGWEACYSEDAAFHTGEGWYACLGGIDPEAPQVTASTWSDLLDEIDDHDMTEKA